MYVLCEHACVNIHTHTHTHTHIHSDLLALPCVVAIPGCQLDCIWNELQSRTGRLSCDSDLEAGRYKFLTESWHRDLEA